MHPSPRLSLEIKPTLITRRYIHRYSVVESCKWISMIVMIISSNLQYIYATLETFGGISEEILEIHNFVGISSGMTRFHKKHTLTIIRLIWNVLKQLLWTTKRSNVGFQNFMIYGILKNRRFVSFFDFSWGFPRLFLENSCRFEWIRKFSTG